MVLQKPKLLITGGSSYLGQHLCKVATEQFEVYAIYHQHATAIPEKVYPIQLDICDSQAVLHWVQQIQPTAIIHTAAINPGQGDEATMYQVNVEGTSHIAQAAQMAQTKLIHVSSDVVHDGQQGPYDDAVEPTPLNAYARSKAKGEAEVTRFCPSATMVRTSLIYGLTMMDRGTAGFVRRLEQGEKLLLFTDVIRQPIWVYTLAEALLRLTHHDFAGILNIAGRQAITREAFGRLMLAWWNIPPSPQLGTGRAVDISANIPLDLRLHVKRAEQLLGMTFPGVEEIMRNESSIKS